MATLHGFWILVTDNRVFDGIVTEHVTAHGDIVVIHGYHHSHSEPYSFENIVSRLHAADPPIRVLFYTWAGRKPLGGTTIGSVPTLDGMEDAHDLLLRDAGVSSLPSLTTAAPSFFWILVSPTLAPGFSSVSARLPTPSAARGSDWTARSAGPHVIGQLTNPKSYPPAFDAMLKGISDTTPLTIFNGITSAPTQE